MCGRYTLFSDKKEIEQHFSVAFDDATPYELTYNAAPGSYHPAILTSGATNRLVLSLLWGYIPSFVKDTNDWKPMINARSETILEKPSFRKSFQRRRCIIPSNGFYEWKNLGSGKKKPFFIRLLDQPLFGMAGIYDTYTDETGKELTTFAILTTRANDFIQPLHERMPVILPEKSYDMWLDPVTKEQDNLPDLFHPWPIDGMATYQVSSDVSNPANDHPELIQPKLK